MTDDRSPSVSFMRQHRIILFLVLCLALQRVACSQNVIRTNVFDIVYGEESAETAHEIAAYADAVFQDICSYLGINVSMSHIPVAIIAGDDTENAYQTTYPYNKILIYDQPYPHMGYWKDTLRGVFAHEAFHLVSLNMKGSFLKGLGAVLGDPYTPVYLVASRSIMEGTAVAYESAYGEGRLNSPLEMAALLQAKLEGRFPVSYLDATGVRDTSPTGNLTYLFGGAWMCDVRARYGKDAYVRFLHDCNNMLLPVDFPVWFKKEFGVWPEESWDAWKASIPLTVVAEATRPLESRRDLLFPSCGGKLLSGTTAGGEVFLDRNRVCSIKNLTGAATNGEGDVVVTFLDGTDAFVGKAKVVYRGGTSKTLDPRHIQEAVFLGERIVLLQNASQHQNILVCNHDGVTKRVIPLPNGMILSSLDAMGEAKLVCIVRIKGIGKAVMTFDLESGRYELFFPPSGVEVGSVSSDGKEILVTWATMGTLSRVAFLDSENGDVRFQDEDVAGGIVRAARTDGGLVAEGAFFDHTALAFVDVSRLRFRTLVAKTTSGLIGRYPLSEERRSESRYLGWEWLRKGTVIPIFSTVRVEAGTRLSLWENGYAVGLSRISRDPMDTVTFLAGAGWDPVDAKWSAVTEATGKRWSVFGQMDLAEGGIHSWAFGLAMKKAFGSASLKNTVWGWGVGQAGSWRTAWSDTLSATYSTIRLRDVGPHSYGGVLFSPFLSWNAQPGDSWSWWNLGVMMRVDVPYLLPFHSRLRTTNLPIRFTLRLSPSRDVTLFHSVECILFSREIQRGTPVVHLFFRRLDVDATYEEYWLRSGDVGSFPLFSSWKIDGKIKTLTLACYLETTLNNTALETDHGRFGVSVSYRIGTQYPWSFSVLFNILPAFLN